MVFKMKGHTLPGPNQASPMKNDGTKALAKAGTKTLKKSGKSGSKNKDVVSYESPGPGWTKLRGTNIWSPPKKGELDGGELD